MKNVLKEVKNLLLNGIYVVILHELKIVSLNKI
jgi:hypothetical protein